LKYFVYYNDGYGVENKGFEKFDYIEDAEDFILLRLKKDSDRKLTDYNVVYGTEKQLNVAQQIEKIKII